MVKLLKNHILIYVIFFLSSEKFAIEGKIYLFPHLALNDLALYNEQKKEQNLLKPDQKD